MLERDHENPPRSISPALGCSACNGSIAAAAAAAVAAAAAATAVATATGPTILEKPQWCCSTPPVPGQAGPEPAAAVVAPLAAAAEARAALGRAAAGDPCGGGHAGISPCGEGGGSFLGAHAGNSPAMSPLSLE